MPSLVFILYDLLIPTKLINIIHFSLFLQPAKVLGKVSGERPLTEEMQASKIQAAAAADGQLTEMTSAHTGPTALQRIEAAFKRPLPSMQDTSQYTRMIIIPVGRGINRQSTADTNVTPSPR